MRIALLTEVFLPKVDGIVNTLCHLLNHLEAKGHSSILVAPQGAPLRYASTPIYSVPAAGLPFYPELRIGTPLSHVDKLLDRFNPDLIHVLNPISLSLPGIYYAKQRGIPLVASYHTDLAGFASRWGMGFVCDPLWSLVRTIHNQADLNLCPSNATLNDLDQRGFTNLRVWSRGVNTAQYHPRKANREWRLRLTGGEPEKPLLLYVGRLSMEKRIDWIADVLAAFPQARLAIVGDGPQRAVLETKFENSPVIFTGYLRGEELASAYASSDIFVFPAANETFGNVILEAMASGLPVVAPQAGGPMDFIQHGLNGLFFEPESRGSLTEMVGELIRTPQRARIMGSAGRILAEKRGWTEVLDGLLTEYEELIAMGSRLGANVGQANPLNRRTTPALPRQQPSGNNVRPSW